jgi:transcriptional regulator with XRE-family HTH domain
MEFLANQLKKRRKEKNLTQIELAKLAGVSKGMIADLETGKNKNPRVQGIKKIGKVLDVDEIYFYIDEENARKIFPHLENEPKKFIDFILDSQNIDYFKMAYESFKEGIPVETMQIYIDLERRRKELTP